MSIYYKDKQQSEEWMKHLETQGSTLLLERFANPGGIISYKKKKKTD